METLDLAKPGKLKATLKEQETATFYIVLPKAGYTKDALSANPTISPADQLMAPFAVSRAQAADGNAVCDLVATGRAREIADKCTAMRNANQPLPETVKAVIIATARAPNKMPPKQLAEVVELKLAPPPLLNLKGVTAHVTVQQYKNGTREFVVEVETQALTTVDLSSAPGAQIKVDGGGAGANVRADVSGGKKLTVRVAVPFSSRTETRNVNHPFEWQPGSNYYYRDPWTERQQQETWTGGDITLRAAGSGPAGALNGTILLRAESWGSGWLATQPPPPWGHPHT